MKSNVNVVLEALKPYLVYKKECFPLRIVIDGPSGAGKTTLATQLAQHLDAEILHLDDMYEGWGGLRQGTQISENLLAHKQKHFVRWDWGKGTRTETITPNDNKHWIVEGCGALTPNNSQNSHLSVWVETNPLEAKRRVEKRDGTANWWNQWHRQELQHWAQNRPWILADLVIHLELGVER